MHIMVQIISYQWELQNFIKRDRCFIIHLIRFHQKVYCKVSWYVLCFTVHNLSCFRPRTLLTAICKTFSDILTIQEVTCNCYQFYITIQEISKTEKVKIFLSIISYNQSRLTFWFLACNYSLNHFSFPS